MKKRYVKAGRLVLAVMLFTGLAASCSSGNPAPDIQINSPVSGSTVISKSITVTVSVSNFALGQQDAAATQNSGYIVYYLDVTPPTHYGRTALTERGTYHISTDKSFTWENVTPGYHVLSAQLVTVDNIPLGVAKTSSVAVTSNYPPYTTTARTNILPTYAESVLLFTASYSPAATQHTVKSTSTGDQPSKYFIRPDGNFEITTGTFIATINTVGG